MTSTTVGLPNDACAPIASGPTFRSLDCRLAALLARIGSDTSLGPLRPKLFDALHQAKGREEQAEALCRVSDTRRARVRLKQLARKVADYVRRLSRPSARRAVAPGLRIELRGIGEGVKDDARALRRALLCPQDALRS